MGHIKIKKDSPPVKVTPELMHSAYADAVEGIKKGASKTTITMGFLCIDFMDYTLKVEIEKVKNQ